LKIKKAVLLQSCKNPGFDGDYKRGVQHRGQLKVRNAPARAYKHQELVPGIDMTVFWATDEQIFWMTLNERAKDNQGN
jgi:hypothetical protein